MSDHIALIGSTGFFEVFEPAAIDERYSYYHFPAAAYHWSDGKDHGGGSILYLQNGQHLTLTGARITRDERIRDLVLTVERL